MSAPETIEKSPELCLRKRAHVSEEHWVCINTNMPTDVIASARHYRSIPDFVL
jgi:hypothetical protein